MAVTDESQELRNGIRRGEIDPSIDRQWWEYVVNRIYDIERRDDEWQRVNGGEKHADR